MECQSAAWLPPADYRKVRGAKVRMINMWGTGIACFENYQPPWSGDTRIKKWPSGKDQIGSTGRQTRSKDEAEGVVLFRS